MEKPCHDALAAQAIWKFVAPLGLTRRSTAALPAGCNFAEHTLRQGAHPRSLFINLLDATSSLLLAQESDFGYFDNRTPPDANTILTCVHTGPKIILVASFKACRSLR